METKVQETYKECLEKKAQIEICYKVLRENYIKYRIEIFNKSEDETKQIKEELIQIKQADIKNDEITKSYKELLLRYMVFKKKIELLIKFA